MRKAQRAQYLDIAQRSGFTAQEAKEQATEALAALAETRLSTLRLRRMEADVRRQRRELRKAARVWAGMAEVLGQP